MSPARRSWIEREAGGRVVAWRRLAGGITSLVCRVALDRDGLRQTVVLKQFDPTPQWKDAANHEAKMLGRVREAGLPVPSVLATASGDRGEGPALLMSDEPGAVLLTPADRESWLRQMAQMAARIHHADIDAPAFQPWMDPGDLQVPARAHDPALWERASIALTTGGGASVRTFIHRDYQHFNLLWQHGRLSAVVDWQSGCIGPPDVDVGHCGLNLAVLYGHDWAQQFRYLYEETAGRVVDPWWELHALASYNDSWPRFVPTQVAGRYPVDVDGMTRRVEQLVETVLQRLDR